MKAPLAFCAERAVESFVCNFLIMNLVFDSPSATRLREVDLNICIRRWGPCSLCPRGSFSDITSASVCTLCPAGTYAWPSGQTACTICPKSAQADSSLLLPENSDVCSACLLCCTTNCLVAAPAITTSGVTSKTTSPLTHLNPKTTALPTRNTSKLLLKSSTTSTTALITAAYTTTPQKGLSSEVCGDGILELYSTQCW